MTKLLYCQVCVNIVSLNPNARQPKWCGCGRHAAWWENPSAGDIRLYDKHSIRLGDHINGIPNTPAAFVLGLHNELLRDQSAVTTEAFVKATLDRTPEHYIFKQAGSLIIKFRPGMSGDSRWAEYLPGESEIRDV